MKKSLGLALLGFFLVCWLAIVVRADSTALYVAYPPKGHKTTAAKIFLIGTAPMAGQVTVNGTVVARSPGGHFAPSFPLQVGENLFTLRYQRSEPGDQPLTIRVTRLSTEPVAPVGMAFGKDSLTPARDIARLPGELICFGTIAPPKATVSVKLGTKTIVLAPQTQSTELPANSAVLTQQNQPQASPPTASTRYQGCDRANTPGSLRPEFQLTVGGKTIRQAAPGRVEVLAPERLAIVKVILPQGTARTGPSTDYSRLTPLPKGTQATVTGREGEWLRLDYGGWIKQKETRMLSSAAPPQTIIRSIRARQQRGWTEIIFPLQVPVPIAVQQSGNSFTLTLHNTTAQTDTIALTDDRAIANLTWQQASPNQVQYLFTLKSSQQWGYKLRYEGTSLILSLRHPPEVKEQAQKDGVGRSLAGIKILLDPGHGGPEDLGSRGPTGYPEKDVALITTKLLRSQLLQRGATVQLTRDTDRDLDLGPRVAMIETWEPTIALSLHYNALPDDGDALKTQGVGTFWYQPQAHSLAVFLHNYLVKTLDRPTYGVFWNNLALTRPTVAPSVLLELGFMINPTEFEWITNPQEQDKLAKTIADGITLWITQSGATEKGSS